jgi:transmembrane sensor
MKALSRNIARLALGKADDAPLSNDEQDICEEWTSGKAMDYMKVDTGDPRLLEYAGLYDKLENKKEAVWESIVAAHSLTIPVQDETPVVQMQTGNRRKRTWMVAAILTGSIIGGIALYQLVNNNKQPDAAGTVPVVAEKPIEPGRQRALLILANKTEIDLDTARPGIIAYQDQMEISKENDNQLVYKISDNHKPAVAALDNNLKTPYGGEYKVTLADGTKVWLNAGSSLKYPAAFNGNDRTVEIKGEGYFEVAENKAKPFRVLTGDGTEVKVLGTRFNVKAYEGDKAVTATLVSGAVAIQNGNEQKNIRPNQQAIVTSEGITIKNRSKEEVTQQLAWKNGQINFEGETAQSILKQIERWYIVETRVEPGTPETTLTGNVDKTTSLADVLKLLNTTNESVLFTLEGHTVVAKSKNN